MVQKDPLVYILAGPTATGKSKLALEFAGACPGMEIINADSLLVYRGMDIGTAKPSVSERKSVSHHLIDIREPNEPFTAGDFAREANNAIEDIQKRGKKALIVGGSGFYLKALLYGLWQAPKSDPSVRGELEMRSNEELYEELRRVDPDSLARITRNDRYRLIRAMEIIRLSGFTPSRLEADVEKNPDPRFRLFVIDRVTDELDNRIRSRTAKMLENGLVEEVKKLRARFPSAQALSAVGYKQVCDYLDEISPKGRKIRPGLAGLEDEIVLATKQLVKRQRTWFRSEKSATWFMMDRDRLELEKQLRIDFGI